MIHDPIVAEVRAIREQLAAQFDFDIRKIVADSQQRQRLTTSKVVTFQRVMRPAQKDAAPETDKPGIRA